MFQVYDCELEKVPSFEYLSDMLMSFPLKSGRDINSEQQRISAHLKVPHPANQSVPHLYSSFIPSIGCIVYSNE